MADDSTPTTTTGVVFTDGESKLFLSIMKHLSSDIQFDADAVAADLDYKDGSIVKTRWGQIKRKKLTAATGASPEGIKKRSPKKSTPVKKAKAADDGSDEADGDDAEKVDTPTKAAKKKRGAKAKTPKKDEGEGEEVVKEEDEMVEDE